MPAPLPTVFIKTDKSVSDAPNLMENVMNDPTIQEMLKQNPGHTLTLVRLPDGQMPPIQLDNLPSSETVLIGDHPVQVHLSNQTTSSPGRMPGRAGRKRKRRKTEDSEEEEEAEVGEDAEEEEVVQKVTRSGRVIKPPSYQGKYYVGLKGKTYKVSEPSEENNSSSSDVNGVKKSQTFASDSNSKPVKKGPGRPRKYPPSLSEGASEAVHDPVPRYQISRLAKQVSSWDFMLMRAAGQCPGKSGKLFYSELLKEFKTLLVNMRRLSDSVLHEIPESSSQVEEDNGTVRLSENLASSLGQRMGSFKADVPSHNDLPKRVIHWLGADASNFPDKKEREETLLSATLEDGLPQQETVTAESLLQTVESFTNQTEELNLVEPTLTTQEELAEDPGLQDPTVPLMTTQVQGALVPQGSVIMEMEDGTFMAQTPDGATMEIQAPDSMTLEALSELLDQATGALAATSIEAGLPLSESLEKEHIPDDSVSMTQLV
ncbi:putative flocculation protein FLO11 [Apostichopus japonicus]|uniref:Putative flocculation protein FLO11 n=1 Tax=Stichopus japonicus TaxID=307972 RepID=A0A2G8LQM1_STIJA|nr:putative flocculation protein FLO11 [Apostichopus japonicus]